MKNRLILYLCTITLISEVSAQTKAPFKLEKIWEITGFKNPESVVIDVNEKVLYVSNTNKNSTVKASGYISKIDLNGKIINEKWAVGLNVPRGLAISENKLYVADEKQLTVIDLQSAKIIKKYEAKKSTFLNDVVVGNGDVYASNMMGGGKIYRLRNGKLSLWIDDIKLNSPNGLILDSTDLYVATWGAITNDKTFETRIPGRILKIDLSKKTISPATPQLLGNLDGYVKTIHGYLVSDWMTGKLIYLNHDNELVDDNVITLSKGVANIEFNRTDKVLYIPLMLDNKVVAYRFTAPAKK